MRSRRMNMKKTMAVVAAASMTAAIPVYASEGMDVDNSTVAADTDRTVKVAYTAIPDSLNPTALTMEVPSAINSSQIYDFLLTKELDGSFAPHLAESWEVSDDATEYTFNLREGVYWSDGIEFTAADVIATFDAYKSNGAYDSIYGVVDTVEAVDDYTVKITLSEPTVTFLSNMTNTAAGAILSANGLETYGEEYGTSADKTVCVGPYTVTDFVPDVSITYVSNDEYYLGTPDIKSLEFLQILDTNSAVVALQTGELDVYFNSISGTSYDMLAASPNVSISTYTSARTESIYFYQKDGMWSDLRMRQAVAYAVKQEEALQVAARGMGVLVRYPGDIGDAMTANPDYEPSISYDYDLEKAKELVKEAGYEGADVVIKSYSTEPYATLSVWLQNVLSQIGLNATVESMERSAFIDARKNEEVPICIMSWVGSSYDIDEILCSSVSSADIYGANYGFYINDEMDELIAKSRAISDEEERKEVISQIIEKIYDECIYVPLYTAVYAIPRSAELTVSNPRSYSMFGYSWVKE